MREKLKKIALLILLVSMITGCGKGASISEDNNPNISSYEMVDISSVPKDFYVPVGEELILYIAKGVSINTQTTDTKVSLISSYDIYNSAETEETGSLPQDGHYYRIFNNYLGVYLSSKESDCSDGMSLYYDAGEEYTIWKANESNGGFYFEAPNGFLSAKENLLCDDEGSEFLLRTSDAEFSENSYGLITTYNDQEYRLDILSPEKVIIYADDGVTYPHTSFRFLEVKTKDVGCTRLVVTGNGIGDTKLNINEEEYNIHVYDPEIQNVDFSNGGEVVLAPGYNLPDSDIHDEGFFSYQCDPASGKIKFISVKEGKAKVKVGDLEYYVRYGGDEATYNGQNYHSLYAAIKDAKANADGCRFENQIINLECEDVLYDGVLPNGVLIKPASIFEMGDAIMLTYTVEGKDGETNRAYNVFPKKMDDKMILFLPSSANYSNLNIHLPKGTTITTPENDKSISVENNNEGVDLSVLFGDMSQAGRQYPVTVTWASGNLNIKQNIVLMKAGKIDSLFFEVEKEGIDDMVSWLNSAKTNKVKSGYAIMMSPKGKVVYDGELQSFHNRGNSNVGIVESKQSIGFKLEKKAKLLRDKKAKSWCLVANSVKYRDTTTYGTAIGESLYSYMNSGEEDDYAVKFAPVDVYINGEYRGVYMLTDKVNDDRVNITKSKYAVKNDNTKDKQSDESDVAIAHGIEKYWYAPDSVLEENGGGGYVIELCGAADPSSYGFVSRRGVSVEIKEPSCPTKDQVAQIAIYYQNFEDALYSENGVNDAGLSLAELIDYRSFCKYYVLKSFLRDMDFFWGSVYMYIDADSSGFLTPLKCCAAWDFDGCNTMINSGDGVLFDNSLYADNSAVDYKWQFLEHEDFVAVLRQMSTEKVYVDNTMSFTDLVLELMQDEGYIDNYFSDVNASMCMNKVIWRECTWESSGETTASIIKGRLEHRVEEWENIWANPGEISNVPVKKYKP